MKKKYTLYILLLCFYTGLLQAQSLPLDFESGSYTITNFEGGQLSVISNPFTSGINTSAKVAKMIKGVGATYAGSFISLSTPIDFTASNTISMKVYSPRSGAAVLLKIEKSDNQNIFLERTGYTTLANQWETIEFNFSGAASNLYSKVVLIFDNGIAGDGSANFTFYLDDIQLVTPLSHSLSDLRINGTTIAGFNPSNFNYQVALAEGASIPAITAIAYDPNATLTIIPATTVPGTTTVEVRAGDNSASSIYRINFFIQGLVCSSGLTGNSPGASTYVLIWEDDFLIDGPPCSDNWSYDIGAGGWGNGELQYYTNRLANAEARNGVLTIKAIKENYGGSQYTSARLKTKDKYEFTYGRIDIRAKLPVENGTWSALWMLGADFPQVPWPSCGEIDIMEQTGNNQNTILGTTHNNAGSGGGGVGGTTFLSTPDQFHIYSIEWNENQISFLLDNVQYFVYSPVVKTFDNYPYISDFFMIMNVAMGGTLGGSIDPAFTQASMEVDYVRVYQKETSQQTNGPITAAPAPPARNASDVISIFSNSYANLSGINYNPNWGQSTIATTASIASNSTLKYANFNYQGTEFNTSVDVSDYEYLHVDMWTENASLVNVSCISPGPREVPYSLPVTSGQWVAYDIPLTAFAQVVDMNEVFQLKFDGTTGSTIYLDNIYFYNQLSGDATLSDIRINGSSIAGFSPSTTNYTVVLAPGATQIPVVTATSTIPGSNVVVNATATLPGVTTILVTSENQSLTQTYTVEFEVQQTCIHDIDGSGFIGGGDILEVLNSWGSICE